MSSFATFLAESTPWKPGTRTVWSSIQTGEQHFDAHGYVVAHKDLDEDFLRAMMQLLHTPHHFFLHQFYHLLLATKIEPVFKSAFDSDIPEDPYMGKWMRENSSGHFLKRIGLFFKQVPEIDHPQAAQLAEWLVHSSPDRSAVKWGLLFLGFFNNRSCKNALTLLGSHEEFTLYATHALVSLHTPCEEELWAIAKAVKGEEREAPIEALVNTLSIDIQRWMLCEGFKGNAYRSYRLASIFAKTGNLYERLKENNIDQALLEGAGLIVAELVRIPGAKQDHYPYDKEVLQLFLQHLSKHELNQDLRNTLYAIQHSLTKICSDSSNGWKVKGWTTHEAMRMLKLLEPFLEELNLIFQKTACCLKDEPTCLVFDPRGHLLLIGDASGTITTFDLVDGTRAAEFSAGNAAIIAMGFHLGLLYTFDAAYSLKKWVAHTGACIRNQVIVPPSNSDKSYDLLACFVPHTPYLAISFGDDYDLVFNDPIQVDIEKGERTGLYEIDWNGEGEKIVSLIASRDGSQLSAFFLGYFGSWGPSHFHLYIEQWNAATCRKTRFFSSDSGMNFHHSEYNDGRVAPRQAFSPDGKRLLYTFDGFLNIWETYRGDDDQGSTCIGHWDATELAWSPINDIIAFGRKPGDTICFLDLNREEILFQDKPFNTPIKQIAFSSDGNYAATFSKDLEVAVYCMKPHQAPLPQMFQENSR